MADNKDAIPYVCYYNGLSLLAAANPHDQNILGGFTLKKQLFMTQKKQKASECTNSLQQAFNQTDVESDSLMPNFNKYKANQFIDVF